MREAIAECGVRGLTVLEVKGIGNQLGHVELSTDSVGTADLVPKLRVEVVVDDAKAQQCIEAIEKAARTGRIGDGKVFVSSVEHVIRIRTGEQNQDAL